MLVRTSKDKNNPYVMVNKFFLEDVNLSLKAKGLLAFCMSKHDGWEFNVMQMTSMLKEGREAIYSAFQELIEHGYCVRLQKRAEKGRFSTSDCILYETPRITDSCEENEPCAGNPDTEESYAAEADAAPYIGIKNEGTNKLKREGDKPPSARAFKFKKSERAPYVLISDHEHQDLVAKYGETKTLSAYERISKWKQNTPRAKWKKSDYLSIQNWVMNALDEDEAKSKKGKAPPSPTPEEPKALEEANRNWFKQIVNALIRPSINEVLGDYYEHVQFSNHNTNNQSEKILYKSPNFKDLVKHELSKRQYKMQRK